MNTAKHTPGPWTLEEWHSDYGPTGDFSVYATGVKRKFPIASIQEPFNGKKTKANARLIAAAPDLLAALRHLEMLSGQPSMRDDPVRVAARAAIAKATGDTA